MRLSRPHINIRLMVWRWRRLALTEPPHKIRISSAISLFAISAMMPRINEQISCACSSVATLPVPMAQIGSAGDRDKSALSAGISRKPSLWLTPSRKLHLPLCRAKVSPHVTIRSDTPVGAASTLHGPFGLVLRAIHAAQRLMITQHDRASMNRYFTGRPIIIPAPGNGQ